MQEAPTAATPSADTAKPSKLRSPQLLVPATLVVAVLAYLGIAYLVEVFTHESTDDAFITGHIISIAPRISGQVTAVAIQDNQLVRSNELLVALDPADLSLAIAQKEATAAAQLASYKTMIAGWELMQTKVATAEAAARKAKADVEAADATLKKAQADFTRASELRKQNTISQAEFDAEQAAITQAQAARNADAEAAAEAVSKVEEANRTLAAAWAQAGTALVQWHEAKTNIAVARQNFSYTQITAPDGGRITRKAVEPGDYVQAGQQLLTIVPNEVWVIANFKESQLKNMRPGQPVTVEIDALGGKRFAAHVDSVQAGSGAAFSLLPPENATGNFVKVVQRVPVKIVFDEALPADHVLGPGLSVTPSVLTSQFIFPVWAIGLSALLFTGSVLFLVIFLTGRKAK